MWLEPGGRSSVHSSHVVAATAFYIAAQAEQILRGEILNYTSQDVKQPIGPTKPPGAPTDTS